MVAIKAQRKLFGLHARWALFFVIWLGLLSGFFGSPGVLQLIRLLGLLRIQQVQFSQIEQRVQQEQAEKAQWEKDSVMQEREIRRVLGYISPEEWVFDFSDAHDE